MRRVSKKWLMAVGDWVECRYFGTEESTGAAETCNLNSVDGRLKPTSRKHCRIFLCNVANMTYTLRHSIQCVDLSCLVTEGNTTFQKLLSCTSTAPPRGRNANATLRQEPSLGAATELVLSQTHVTYVPNLSRCSMLRKLDLSGCLKLTNEGLSKLPSAPALEELNLSRTLITTIQPLSWCCRLRRLDLRDCRKLESPGLIGVERLPALEVLDLSYSHVTSVGWLWVCRSLKVLNLTGCPFIKTEETVGLERIATLEALLLGETHVTSVRHLCWARRLSTLDLSQCWELTNEGIDGLQRMPNLTDLNLARTNVTWSHCCSMGFPMLQKLKVELCQFRGMGSEAKDEYDMHQELLDHTSRAIPTLKTLCFHALNGAPLVATSRPTAMRECGTRLMIRFSRLQYESAADYLE
jgi:hypothetical protein